MKQCLYVFTLFFVIGCNSVKRTESKLNKGNYDEAIRLSVKKIEKGRKSKASKKHIQLLEEAYNKATEQDLSRINQLKKENLPEHLKRIYEHYLRLDRRQNIIRPLLPLPGASFQMEDYTLEIASSKTAYADYLYLEGNRFLALGTILDARRAHNSFIRLKELESQRENIDSLLSISHFRGTDFVQVRIENRTEQVIPKRLEDAILDFDSYKLDNFWTEYHGNPQKDVEYNFGIVLEIRQILISPDRLYEKEFDREKRVSDGWEYVLDENGNVKKDSLGNDIKVDVFKNLRAKVLVTTQDKSVKIVGNILYRNLKETRNMSTSPIASEFVFEHIFAQFQGDEGALTDRDVELSKRVYVDFPSNEQMIFDTSTDLKKRFSAVLRRKSFR